MKIIMTKAMTMTNDNYDAIIVLITSVLFLFFAFGNFNSFAQVFIYASYDKKGDE
jgi:hypothetical protein